MPSRSCPALAAAPLICTLVLDPLGGRTWAEREIEAVRLGAADETREEIDPRTSFILLALHTQSTDAYALEMMEAPREPEPVAQADRSVEVMADPVLQGAFEAMGLTPEDLVGRPEVPEAAVTIAEAIEGLLDWGLERGAELRARVRGKDALRIDPAERERRPEHLRFQKPGPSDQPKPAPIMISKRVIRSIYKMFLGIAIGILIWAFVRSSG